MSTQIQGPNHHFKAFYKDDSLLIQFIIVEFIQTYQLALQIKTLVQEYIDSIQTSDHAYTSLFQKFGQLIGSLSKQEYFSQWTQGSLTKLKEYCEQFSLNSKHQNESHIHLNRAVYQAWLTAMHHFELLNALKPNKAQKKAYLLISFKRSCHHLQTRFNQVMRYIPRAMMTYWDNENVALCLLRKRTQLAAIYGADFLSKRFKWPIKLDEMISLVIQRYQKRGFDPLLPMIKNIVLEKEMAYDAY